MLKSAFVLSTAVFCALLTGAALKGFGTHIDQPAAAAALTAPPSATPEQVVDGHVTAVPKAQDGHFWANAVVNQKAVKFLVDTGATVVVLTPSDAQRLGFDVNDLTFDRKIITANGQTYAAMVNLSSVGVGESTVRDVQALVVRDGLTTSLLGMSYLGRLSRFEATPSSLILHP